MDPVTIIATALALGATAGIKSVAEQAVRDCYEGLKSLIKARYSSVAIDLLEQKPESVKRRKVVEEDLADAGADQDEEVLLKAKALLDALASSTSNDVLVSGVELKDIKAASLTLADIIATGTGVKIKGGEFQDDVVIKKVRAGVRGDDPKDRGQ